MEEIKELAASADRLLACCMCSRLLHEAKLLKCLHNCCLQCFSTATSTGGSQGVSCGSCGTITQVGSEQPNGFINRQVQRYTSITESRACGVCQGNGEPDKPALMWCAACRHSLCGDCIAGHRQLFRQHVTQSLEELQSLDEVCTQPSASDCPIHKAPLDITCLNCERAKCISCWAECMESNHKMNIVGKEAFESYVSKFIASIVSTESELLRKSEVLEKSKSIVSGTKEARDRQLEEITLRKRRIVDAVEMVYQEVLLSTKNAYDVLEADENALAAAADRIAADLSDARSYIRRLVESNEKCEILNQKHVVRERLNVLSAELDSLSDRLITTNKEVQIEALLPENLENVVRAWIGVPREAAASPTPASRSVLQQALTSPSAPQFQVQQQQQQQQQSFSFGAASASLQLPLKCLDIALTHDGRSLLLAATGTSLAADQWHGLIELSSTRERELGRWRPPSSNTESEQVVAVAALSDGRAAVSLLCAQLVALLRRREEVGGDCSGSTDGAAAAAAGDDAWTEDRRLEQLPWISRCLSVQGDVLAACEWSRGAGRLKLLSLSSGRPLSVELQREYRIGSLAVAARAVVTGSYDKVKLGDGRRAAHVLDAHSLDVLGGNDKRLWRRVLSSSGDNEEEEVEEERLQGVCADSSGSCLYAAVCRSDKTSGRVSALSLIDGSELRRVALSFHLAASAPELQPPLLLPMRLSLCDDNDGATATEQQLSSSSGGCGRELLLAVLCLNPTTFEQKTVTLHHSTHHTL